MNKVRIIIVLFFLVASVQVPAQNDSIQRDEVHQKIERYLTDKEYTRIPNKDFDLILHNRIEAEVKERLMFWLTLITIIIAVFGGVAAIAFNLKIKQVVQSELEKKNEEHISNINKLVAESKINKHSVNVETLTKKSKINAKLEAKRTEGYRVLEEAKELNYKESIPEIIDAIVGVLFYQRNSKEVDELIEEYEKEFPLKSTTYANGALLHLDSYELDGVDKYKEKCEQYCNAAIDHSPYYGHPRGTLIMLYAIDYTKSESEEEKEEAKTEVKSLISEILKGASGYIASNTCLRLEKEAKIASFKKYLINIQQALPEEFKKLFDKADAYDQKKALKST